MKLSVTQAAKAAGVSRTTIYEKLNSGELSRQDGKIDTSELLRVFGELKGAGDSTDSEQTVSSPEAHQAQWFQSLIDRQQEQIEALNEQLREAQEQAHDREQTWQRQLDKVTALLPAPEEQEPEQVRPGLWQRVFG